MRLKSPRELKGNRSPPLHNGDAKYVPLQPV